MVPRALRRPGPATYPEAVTNDTLAWPPAAEGPPTGPAADGAPVRRPRRVARWTAAVLAVLLAASLGLSGYLLVTTQEWQASSEGWEELARQHGADLAQTQAELAASTAELEATRGQLATAQERITALADEKARLGDDNQTAQQLVEYQARVSAAAGEVATALATCIDGQERLIGYLADAESYDPDQLAQFAADVERVCGAASDANDALQEELTP